MRIPIGQTFEFSIKVLEESGLAPEDMHNMSNAVFGIYDVDPEDGVESEVIKLSTVSNDTNEDGTILPDYSGTRTTKVTTVLKNQTTGDTISTEETEETEDVEDIVASYLLTVGDPIDMGDGTEKVITTEVEALETYKGYLRFALTSVATDKLSESRRGIEDRFSNKVKYRGVVVVNVDGRASITAEISRIEALMTPAL